jgi:hypothetical protein
LKNLKKILPHLALLQVARGLTIWSGSYNPKAKIKPAVIAG